MTYDEAKKFVTEREEWAEAVFRDVLKALWRTKSKAGVSTKVVSLVPSELLAARITRAKRYLGREKSRLLNRWLEMDSTLLGNTKNEIDLFGIISWMKHESVSNVRAYLSGLRQFYAKRAS
jgi:hypothetical protein